jgi:cysteinyl-tRNA synthetase
MELQAGARVEVDDRKHNPLDFALWKSSKPGEPAWDSPWGPGRPGWHIECSAMAMRFADGSLDIHAGGQDLMFPHHENEIAQSESATGKQFARYWMHNGFLDIEGEKMSKSLGNFLTVRDILKQYDPMAVRTFFLMKHYRSPIDFSEERMKEAWAAFLRLKHAREKIEREFRVCDVVRSDQSPELVMITQNRAMIEEALDDDFNTAKAIGHFFEIARIVNQIEPTAPGGQAAFQAAEDVFDIIGTDVFGLDFSSRADTSDLAESLIGLLIELRRDARAQKNFGLADTIRKKLAELGIQLEDRPEGTAWKQE